MPTLKEEFNIWNRGYKRVAGIDEAGRGPLAGPVVAAAVIVNSLYNNKKIKSFTQFQNLLLRVKDSKKLSEKERQELYVALTKNSLIEWGIGVVAENIIDKINIKNAAELAMERAVIKLKKLPDFLIIDGNHLSNTKLNKINHKLIVRADDKVFSCAAASIMAKVARDRIMLRYSRIYPEYRFDLHKGYPTKLHKRMLDNYGLCDIHRRSFAPIRNMVK